jgi:hypothetical protein
MDLMSTIERSNEILDWKGVGNRQLFLLFQTVH